MNPAQLSALFAQHKTAVLGTAAAGVVGLALYQRKVKAPAAGAVTPTAGATIPGTIPAAAVAPTGSYDSSSSDLYQALQPTLEQILAAEQTQQTTGTGITSAPKPIASTLFNPTGSGLGYVRYGNGTIAEVESDGSVYGIAPGESWNYSGPNTGIVQLPYNDNSAGGPAYSDKLHNLTAAGKAPA